AESNTLQQWDIATGRQLRVPGGHLGEVFSVVWSHDGKVLLSAGDTIRGWEPRTGKELLQGQTRLRGVSDLALAPDGRILAAGGVDGIVVYDLKAHKEVRRFPPQSRFTLNLGLSP